MARFYLSSRTIRDRWTESSCLKKGRWHDMELLYWSIYWLGANDFVDVIQLCLAMASPCRRQLPHSITTGTPAGGPGLWATGHSRRTSPAIPWTWSPAPAACTCSACTSACRRGCPACRAISGGAFSQSFGFIRSVPRIWILNDD